MTDTLPRPAWPTELAQLSPAGFDAWPAMAPFGRFVFGLFADRLANLKALAEAVAFQRLDSALLSHGAVVQGTPRAPSVRGAGRA